MAVTALSLHGQHPDDTSEGSSYEEDGDQLMNSAGPGHDSDTSMTTILGSPEASSIAGSSISSTHLLLLHKRILQTYPQLSRESLLLLAQASMPTPPISSTSPSLLMPLCNQLESLRELIPPQPTKVSNSSPSCIITDALDYIDQVNREIQSLHEGIKESIKYHSDHDEYPPSPVVGSTKGFIKVEYLKDSSLHVHVQCIKRHGILSSILFALDSLELVVNKMDVSCNQMLTLDVITSKVKEKKLEGDFVRQILQSTILRGV